MKHTSTSKTLTACILTVLIVLPFISASFSRTTDVNASSFVARMNGQPTTNTAPLPRQVLRTFAPFWRVGDGFASTLIVRNVDRQSSVSAAPIVFTANKQQLRLPVIQLAPSEVKRIPLEQALQAAGSSAKSGAIALQMDKSQSAAI